MENQDNIQSGFSYLIAEKNKLLAISLIGPLTLANQSQLDTCLNEVAKHEFLVAVINFRDVDIVDSYGTKFLAHLQKSLRKKSPEIGICGLNLGLRDRLSKEGVIRYSEIYNNMRDALVKLNSKKSLKKEAA